VEPVPVKVIIVDWKLEPNMAERVALWLVTIGLAAVAVNTAVAAATGTVVEDGTPSNGLLLASATVPEARNAAVLLA
jgi:hypothetical protein